MKLEDVCSDALHRALDDLPAQFPTTQLSNHKVMVEAHRNYYEHDKYYHA